MPYPFLKGFCLFLVILIYLSLLDLIHSCILCNYPLQSNPDVVQDHKNKLYDLRFVIFYKIIKFLSHISELNLCFVFDILKVFVKKCLLFSQSKDVFS